MYETSAHQHAVMLHKKIEHWNIHPEERHFFYEDQRDLILVAACDFSGERTGAAWETGLGVWVVGSIPETKPGGCWDGGAELRCNKALVFPLIKVG